jgi:serine/threonine protein kinase
VDIWALGCLYFEMLAGDYAFPLPADPDFKPVPDPKDPALNRCVTTVILDWAAFIRRVGSADYRFPPDVTVSAEASAFLKKVNY